MRYAAPVQHHLNESRLRGLRAAIIDLDGTLVDTVGDFVVALGAMAADLGLPAVTAAFVRRTVGKGSEHLISCALAEAAAPASRFDEAWARYQLHYQRINGRHSQVFEGTQAGLAALAAQGLVLVCLTNKPGAFARPLLEAKGLARWFAHVFGGDAFERKKPDPLPLLEVCRLLGLAPAQVLMVGDSSNDAAAARAAGCPVVLLRHGYNHDEPVEAAGADAVLDRLDTLPPLLAAAGCGRRT